MRAMVFTEPGRVEMLEVERPDPGDDEVVIRVAAAGICGSELHGISKPGFRQPPLIMGHEFAGTAPDGRRVTVNPIINCGTCDLCVAGHEQLCRIRSILGVHRSGGFADQVAVPVRMVHDIPDDLTWERAAMIEPLANGVHAWRLAGRPRGARVGIIGAGTIGLVSLLAVAADASEVHVTDLVDDRLAVARALGATSAGSSLEGEFDVIIDAVGAPATHAASVAKLKPRGTAVWLGLLATDAAYDATDLVRMEKTVQGSFAYTRDDFADAIELSRHVDLDWTTNVPLDEGARVFHELAAGRTDIVKALLRPL
jgi:threonine dehydrogenase-like Zn-dependent dehydrogenase